MTEEPMVRPRQSRMIIAGLLILGFVLVLMTGVQLVRPGPWEEVRIATGLQGAPD